MRAATVHSTVHFHRATDPLRGQNLPLARAFATVHVATAQQTPCAVATRAFATVHCSPLKGGAPDCAVGHPPGRGEGLENVSAASQASAPAPSSTSSRSMRAHEAVTSRPAFTCHLVTCPPHKGPVHHRRSTGRFGGTATELLPNVEALVGAFGPLRGQNVPNARDARRAWSPKSCTHVTGSASPVPTDRCLGGSPLPARVASGVVGRLLTRPPGRAHPSARTTEVRP